MPPDNNRHPDYTPTPPTEQALPIQEPGQRPARALPYELQIREEVNAASSKVKLHFNNTGKAAAVFQVYSSTNQSGPWSYTVSAKDELSDSWTFPSTGNAIYDLSIFGPNGFFRTFQGHLSSSKAHLDISSTYDCERCGLTLNLSNRSETISKISIVDAYTKRTTLHILRPGESLVEYCPLEKFSGWYDLTVGVESDASFQRRLAGHVETGNDSMSDPAIGAN
jgi:phospholipase C